MALFPKSDEHLWNNNGFDIAPYEYLGGHKDSSHERRALLVNEVLLPFQRSC